MIKIVLTAIITILVCIIVFQNIGKDEHRPAKPLDSSALDRISELEYRLDEEIENRIRLEGKLEQEVTARVAIEDQVSELELDPLVESGGNVLESGSYLTISTADENRTLLLDAGFEEAQADWILDLESKRLTDLFEARFGGTASNPREIFHETEKTIRQELGDDLFERYLETRNRPTQIPIGGIAEDSAGEKAGLQVGDKIIKYDGERVFSMLDLRDATQTGTPGQTVIIDVRRDNSTVSIAIPRGRIGVSTPRFDFSRNRR